MIVSSNLLENQNIKNKMSQQHQQKTIAPKSLNFGGRNNISTNSDMVSSSTTTSTSRPTSASCRRRIAFHPTLGYAITPTMPAKVARRNARERNRVKQVNCGFEMLRSHIPSAAKNKKMSKVDTLRHAVEYIQNMHKMLHEQQQQQHQQQQQQHQHQQHESQQTQLPPPLHLQAPPTPLTPTPSSRASSVPSPMTPHMPPLQPHHHFILPDAPPYPSPLTPRTPNTPASEFGSAMTVLSNQQFPAANDSGYETSSYYSTTSSSSSLSPNMMSPLNIAGRNSSMLQHPQQHRLLHHHQMSLMSPASSGPLRPSVHLESSPVSPPVYNRPQQYHEMEVSTQASYLYNNYNNIAENPEEEELLDAIAHWQEQGDD